MEIYVCVPMEDGIVRGVEAYASEAEAAKAEHAWLLADGLTDEKARENAADWGTGIAIWKCWLQS